MHALHRGAAALPYAPPLPPRLDASNGRSKVHRRCLHLQNKDSSRGTQNDPSLPKTTSSSVRLSLSSCLYSAPECLCGEGEEESCRTSCCCGVGLVEVRDEAALRRQRDALRLFARRTFVDSSGDAASELAPSVCASEVVFVLNRAREAREAQKERDFQLAFPCAPPSARVVGRRAAVVDLVMSYAAELQKCFGGASADLTRSCVQLAISLLDRSKLLRFLETRENLKTQEAPSSATAPETLTRSSSSDNKSNNNNPTNPTNDEKHPSACRDSAGGKEAEAQQSCEEAAMRVKDEREGEEREMEKKEKEKERGAGSPTSLRACAAFCLLTALQFEAPNSLALEGRLKKMLQVDCLVMKAFGMNYRQLQRRVLDSLHCELSAPLPSDFADYLLLKAAKERDPFPLATAASVELVFYLLDCFALTPEAPSTPACLAGAAAVQLARRILHCEMPSHEVWPMKLQQLTGFSRSQARVVLKTLNFFLTNKAGRFPGLKKLHAKGWAAVDWELPAPR